MFTFFIALVIYCGKKFSFSYIHFQAFEIFPYTMTHSLFLEGFKCESQLKTSKEQGVGACSLARNTLEG